MTWFYCFIQKIKILEHNGPDSDLHHTSISLENITDFYGVTKIKILPTPFNLSQSPEKVLKKNAHYLAYWKSQPFHCDCHMTITWSSDKTLGLLVPFSKIDNNLLFLNCFPNS